MDATIGHKDDRLISVDPAQRSAALTGLLIDEQA